MRHLNIKEQDVTYYLCGIESTGLVTMNIGYIGTYKNNNVYCSFDPIIKATPIDQWCPICLKILVMMHLGFES